ncbi:MAG: FixH family protein [Vicingaceae bacterium]
MKWNWGTKIGLLYTVFVLFIIGMVYMAFNQKYDLVTEDYYAEEIAYQNTIDSKSRTKQLNGNLTTAIEGKYLKLVFPEKEAALKGSVICFRPSDERKDFTEEFNITNGIYKIALSKFIAGKYTLKISWQQNDLSYYKEQIIIIP